MRTRVASSDWCASRKVVSVTRDPLLLAQVGGEALGAELRAAPAASRRAPGPSRSMSGSLLTGSTLTGASPCGLLTVTSASQVSSRVPRSALGRALSRSGCSSMKLVVTLPARKSGSSRSAIRNGMLVATPRIRNSVDRATGLAARRSRRCGRGR